jgi:hypothetical protein
VWVKDQRPIELVDLPAFGRPARLVWHKRRWVCPAASCPVGSFTETATHIAAARLVMTDRAGRWVTEQVGRHKRSVNEVAVELGCDWHTINDTVIAYGTPLVEDPDRIGDVDALGLDETLFARLGRWRHQHWSTSIGQRPAEWWGFEGDPRCGSVAGVQFGGDRLGIVALGVELRHRAFGEVAAI